MRVTDLLREGTNQLVILNPAQDSVTQAMVVADARLAFRSIGTNVVARAGPPTGPLEAFTPAASQRVNFTARELPESRLEVELNGERFVVESEFSTPTPSWEHGSNKFFGHRRRVEQRDEAMLISDTFTNLTSENLPLMHRHRVTGRSPWKKVWLAGLSPSALVRAPGRPVPPVSWAFAGSVTLPFSSNPW